MSEPAAERFAWPAADPGRADDSPLGELPLQGPLADFHRLATVLSRPSDPRRPWVMAAGERVIKAYDLRAFGDLDRRRALAEAETAIAVGEISGVVVTHRTGQVGNWLVIEMERLGETVAEHLSAVAAGERLPLAPSRWGVLLEEVAVALDQLHRRRVIHRDVKPANLIFDRCGQRLVLADFSIATKRRRRAAGREGEKSADVAGTRRYIAPEVFQGRMGYGVDQYGLAVTAEDVLGDAATPAARDVLLRATAQDPEDRFGAVADFGGALRGAVDDDAPRRLSSRLRRVSPKWRHTWGLGAVVFGGAYGVLIASRIPDLGLLAGLLAPLLVAGATMALARLLNRLRGGRTQPRLRLADQPWFPVAVFAVVLIGLRPVLADNPSAGAKFILYDWIGALALAAVLGSTPRNAGEWLIRIVQRWERRRQGQRGRPLRWWGGRVALVALLLTVSWLPAAVGNRWPNRSGPMVATESRPLMAVSRSRAALLGDRPQLACTSMRIPRGEGIVRCGRWAPIAASWLRQDIRASGAAPLTPVDLENFNISYNDGSEKYGAPSWSIWTADGRRNYVGTLAREDEAGKVWDVNLSRRPPGDDPLSFQRSYWEYEVVYRHGSWFVTFVAVCDSTTPDPCVRISQMEAEDLSTVVRRGAPGPSRSQPAD